MKKDIHPKYEETTITCICGANYKTRSTAKNPHVDICSKCHPFFTGKQVYVDTAGRIERFRDKYKIKQGPADKGKIKAKVKDAEKEPEEDKS